MSDLLEAISFRKKRDGKWTADNLGFAKPSEKGGYDITLFALPAPSIYEGNATYKICIRPPTSGANNAPPQQAAQGGGGETPPSAGDLDDKIPFITPWP